MRGMVAMRGMDGMSVMAGVRVTAGMGGTAGVRGMAVMRSLAVMRGDAGMLSCAALPECTAWQAIEPGTCVCATYEVANLVESGSPLTLTHLTLRTMCSRPYQFLWARLPQN